MQSLASLLLLLTSCLADPQHLQEEMAYSPAEYSPAQYSPYTYQPAQERTDQILQTGEWVTVDNFRNQDFEADVMGGFAPDFGHIVRITVGVTILIAIAMFVLNQVGVLDTLAGSPAVQEAIQAIEETIPQEARSMKALLPLAQMAFEAIDKYAMLNQR